MWLLYHHQEVKMEALTCEFLVLRSVPLRDLPNCSEVRNAALLGLVWVEVKEEGYPLHQAEPGMCWHSWALVLHIKVGVQPEIPLTRNVV